jgi:hypothetical protein
MPPCLITIFGNWPEKLIILFVWPYIHVLIINISNKPKTPSFTGYLTGQAASDAEKAMD